MVGWRVREIAVSSFSILNDPQIAVQLTSPGWVVWGFSDTIPSLAVDYLILVPLFGHPNGNTSVIVGSWCSSLYHRYILVAATFTGGVDGPNPSVLRSGSRQWGLEPIRKRWWQVQVPLVLPEFVQSWLAYLRRSVTIASRRNHRAQSSTLDDWANVSASDGNSRPTARQIVAGSIAVAVLAFAVNALLLWLEKTHQSCSTNSQAGGIKASPL